MPPSTSKYPITKLGRWVTIWWKINENIRIKSYHMELLTRTMFDMKFILHT